MKRTLVIIFILLIGRFGFAHDLDSNWIDIYEDGNVTVWVYNKFKSTKNNGIKAWIKYTYQTPQIIDDISYVEIKSYIEYDSDFEKSRCYSSTFYNKDGQVVDAFTTDYPKWEYIIPDTLGEETADFVRAMNK